MLSRTACLTLFALAACLGVTGQETSFGLSVPMTIGGDAQFTHGSPAQDDIRGSTAGFRAVLSPTLSLGPHWFIYAALEAHSSSYFPYQSGLDEDQSVRFEAMQAFAGYTTKIGPASLLIEAGRLSSAFGLFPLEYDDAKMPFVNPPPSYTANLPLRPDQLACGVNDVLGQAYGAAVEYGCGGSDAERYGLIPVGLYGLPSIEAQLSLARLDARIQITNSSPVNPQEFTSDSQFAQWTAGAGYSFTGGLHVGVSGFNGPYLDKNLAPLLPVGSTLRDYSAAGLGIDAQWSRGPWSLRGEWQRFHFDLPGFVISPAEKAEYAEVKRILSPRFFLAGRVTAQHFGRIEDNSEESVAHFSGPQQFYEATLGYRLNRQQLLKAGAGWTDRNAWAATDWFWPQNNTYRFELQLVTSFTAVSKAFR